MSSDRNQHCITDLENSAEVREDPSARTRLEGIQSTQRE